MRRVRHSFAIFAVAVTAFVLGSGTGYAGDSADPSSYREYDIGDGRVTLDVQDAPFGQVVTDLIQPRTTVNIFVSTEAAEQRVTIRAVDLHWVQAHGAMVERIGVGKKKEAKVSPAPAPAAAASAGAH